MYIAKTTSDYYKLYFKISSGKRDVTLYHFYMLFVGNQDKKNDWIRSGPKIKRALELLDLVSDL